MLIKRPFWQQLIEQYWQQRNIIWLMGIRRVGKTSLCQSLDNIEYLDCERPRVRQLIEEDIEGFLAGKKGKRVALDEIHRLQNPSELLKIAADHYPEVKIIATGSSTLGASTKFKDTLTGRKIEIWLTPLFIQEMAAFKNEDINQRFLFGGLPSFFTSKDLPEDFFKEWIDAYWAKDIQDMFRVEKRYSFQKFTELLLAYSGGQFEANKFAPACEVSRQTIANYLSILEETFVVHVIRPYSTHKPTEIISAPKIYGFDTGFACYARGWRELRKEDMGILWEHCVLNEIQGHLQTHDIHYWRDKQGHEIDFVIRGKGDKSLSAIECKFMSSSLSIERTNTSFSENIEIFRKHYPHGTNFLVAHDVDTPFQRHYGEIVIHFENPQSLIAALKSSEN
jgi:predicted AAA+ superfamily ATPase